MGDKPLWGKPGNNKPYGEHWGGANKKHNKPMKRPRMTGGGSKPPSNNGKLCIQIAPIPVAFGWLALGNAIVQSFI